MLNTKDGGGRGPGAGGRDKTRRRARRRTSGCLLIVACCVLSVGCRQDMQDQPRYEAYESSTFFADGQASRPLVEGTVPREPRGAQYVDRQTDYFYTGKMAGAVGASGAVGTAGAGVVMAGTSAGAAAAVPNTAAGGGATQPSSGGGVNERGNAAGGVPGAREAARTFTPDVFPAGFEMTREVLDRGQQRYEAFCSMCHGLTGEGNGMIVRRGYGKPPSYHVDRLQEGQTPAAHFFDVITNGWGAMPSYDYLIPAEDRWKIIAYIRALQLSRQQNIRDLSPEQQEKVRDGQPPHGAEGHGVGQPFQGGEKH